MSEIVVTRRKKKKVYKSRLWYLWGEWVRPIGEAIIIALLVTTFLFTTVGIEGESDMPNVYNGERVFVPKYEMWLHKLGIGSFGRCDLVVLKPPQNAPQSIRPVPILGSIFPKLTYRPYFIKRIVAIAGDKVRMENGILYVNDIKIDENHTVNYWKSKNLFDDSSYLANFPTTIIPKNFVYVIGDNRSSGGSLDSRSFGAVSVDAIAGRATFVWWPPVRKDETNGNLKLNWRTLGQPEAFQKLNQELNKQK